MKVVWTVAEAVEAVKNGAKLVLASHEPTNCTAYIVLKTKTEARRFFGAFTEMMFPDENPIAEIEAELDKFLGIHLELDTCNIAFSGGKWNTDPVLLRVEEDLRSNPEKTGQKLRHLLGLIFERS